MKAIKVLIAVKSAALARAIRHVLHGEAGSFDIDFADSAQSLMAEARRLQPDLVIVNSRLLGRTTAETLTCVKRENPQSKLILACDFQEFAGPIDADTADARVLDDTLVRQLPAIARRLARARQPRLKQRSPAA